MTGQNPTLKGNVLTDPAQSWVRNRYAEPTKVLLVGKDAAGQTKEIFVTIAANDVNSLTLDPTKAIRPSENDPNERPRYINIGKVSDYFKTIDKYEIDYNPSRISPTRSRDAIVRERARGKGFVERFILLHLDRQNVTGENLANVFNTTDQRLQPAVGFLFNAAGGRKFGTLTREHLPEEESRFYYHLAILLDNQVMSAPIIKSEINDQGVIEGMPVREVGRLIEILRAGRLPATLNPTPLLEEKVGATLGQDTIEKGVRAIAISMFVVPIFMILYYRFAGVVAVVALILNMLLLVGTMAITNSSITLPGLAGLALTIGMAVDANVLIFERMREEAERGASMAQQIRNGFSRAWTTILDSHVTTILSGVVLFAIGTEEVKGFALTLIIGLLINLFTAVYVSRVIFDYWYSKGWLKRLTMYKMLDKTNIDFVGPRKICMAVSLVLILIGVGIAAYRWNSLLNIDFTGGTLVTIQLDPNAPEVKSKSPGQRAAYVRELAAQALPDTSVEALNLGDEEAGLRFNIRTTEENAKEDGAAAGSADKNNVQAKILAKFEPILSRLEMTSSAPEALPAAPKDAVGESSERFPGGRRYLLSFNRPVAEPEVIQAKLLDILRKDGVANPETRVLVDRPVLPNGQAALDQKQVYLTTDLDAATTGATDKPGTVLGKLAVALRNDPNQLFERVSIFGGAVAKDTRTLAIMAIVASWLIMVAYLWFRFKSVTYGVAAVIALVHDVLITLGAVALSPYKIDLPMIAAFLTLIGFSVNDTIVIFDRIREIKGKTPVLTTQMINDAINQTLSRTILTSLTAWLVVVIMWLFGGEGLAGFSFCLVVGFLSGTYSTVYIATPILVDWVSRDKTQPAPQKSKTALAKA